jgi:hypothetical protein
VLLAACIETCVIVFFTTFGDAIARGMGGLRNSPAEDVVLGAVSFAAGAAFWVGLVAFGVSLAWRPRRGGVPALGLSPPAGVSLAWRPKQPTWRLGPRQPGRVPWTGLVPLAVFWLLAALWAQPAVQRSARVDRLVQDGEYRAALDFLAAQQPGDFAPSRPLPPKAYEWSTFEELAGMLKASSSQDPEWVQDHLRRRLNEAVDSVARPFVREAEDETELTRARRMHSVLPYRLRFGSADLREFSEALTTVSWLEGWRADNRAFLTALMTHASENDGDDWRAIESAIGGLGVRPLNTETSPAPDKLLLQSPAPGETNAPAP